MSMERWLNRLSFGARFLFHRRAADHELDEELQFHLDAKTEQNIANGMAPEAARRAARIELGGVEQVKEDMRSVRTGAWLDSLLQDVRFALRMLRKSPGFTTVAVLTLALGIGANTAIFSLVNTALLARLPYKDVDRIVWIWGTNPHVALGQEVSVSPGDFGEWRERSTVFETLAGGVDQEMTLTGTGQPQLLLGYAFSANYFTILGVPPELGRTFSEAEDRAGGPHVVVLSDALWRSAFHGDPRIVGRSITLDGDAYAVTGVMPPSFNYGSLNQFWVPFGPFMPDTTDFEHRFVRVIGKLKPDISITRAESEMAALTRQIDTERPSTDGGNGVQIETLRHMLAGDVRTPLLVLLAAVCFVLLTACANVASLLLARMAGRSREIAIRASLGAGRLRLLRQFLTESLLLSLAGGMIGTLLAVSCARLLVKIFPNEIANLNIPRISAVAVDGRVLLFSLAVTLAAAIAFGTLPAMHAASAEAGESLKVGAHSATANRVAGRLRRALVVAEIALSLVLLTGAGLLINSFERVADSSLGFEPDHVLAIEVDPSQNRFPQNEPEKLHAFVANILDKINSLPGVRIAGGTNFPPLSGFWGVQRFNVVGEPLPSPSQRPSADYGIATPDYFRSMGIPLVRGRFFTDADKTGAPHVVVINREFAQRYLAAKEPIGAALNLGTPARPDLWSIVGVVGDVRAFGPDHPVHAELYKPVSQTWFPFLTFTVKTAGDPAATLKSAEQAIWETDPDQAIFKATPMEVLAEQALAVRRISTYLLAGFAALALLLAAIGVYGVMAFAIAQRTHEIGIRMALGAQCRDALRLVMNQGVKLTMLGIAIGLAGAFGLTRLMSGLLFDVSATDPATFSFAVIFLSAVALLACYLPARRAMRVDPMVALRHE